jgi:hypothetical protein
MKIKTYLMAVVLVLTIAACKSGEQKTQTDQKIENVPAEITSTEGLESYWECPMKCEGKKFAAAGNCPVCGMALVEVKMNAEPAPADTAMHDQENHEGHNH